ncbi:MAG: ThuA domain-containing protein [Rubripirellula sp.]
MKKLIATVFAVFCVTPLLTATGQTKNTKKIHVLIWDERQPKQAVAYKDFLGNEIAKRLTAQTSDFEVRSVALDDADQGLTAGNLEWADVIIWWGHVRQSEVTEKKARLIVDYIREGKLDLIALHSAHWARPFIEAMNWRSIEDAKQHFQQSGWKGEFLIESVKPPRERTVPIHGSELTPSYFGYKKNQNQFQAIVQLPWCCFPDYRPDGEPGILTTQLPEHPIARDLPKTFQVPQTEMYNEPFHVPDPDQVIFEETWNKGERFRSGMTWNIGKGKVFYFRPGHETYPVFKQPEMIQVLQNACRWLGQ